MGLMWGGYTLILWGYCKLQGYDVSLTELVMPGKYKGKWPPPLIDDSAGLGGSASEDLGGTIDPMGQGAGDTSKKKTPKKDDGGVFNA